MYKRQVLGNAPLAFVHKTRDIDVANKITSNRVVGDVSGRTCVLLDDMIDTGGTIAGAVKVLREAGANDVIIATTHGVFSDPDHWDNLTVLSIAPLLAKTIHEIFENGSVTNLFE